MFQMEQKVLRIIALIDSDGGGWRNDRVTIRGTKNVPNGTKSIFIALIDGDGGGWRNERVTIRGTKNVPNGTKSIIIALIDSDGGGWRNDRVNIQGTTKMFPKQSQCSEAKCCYCYGGCLWVEERQGEYSTDKIFFQME